MICYAIYNSGYGPIMIILSSDDKLSPQEAIVKYAEEIGAEAMVKGDALPTREFASAGINPSNGKPKYIVYARKVDFITA